MSNPNIPGSAEKGVSRLSKLTAYVGETAYKSWHGHSREVRESWNYWKSIHTLLKIDGKLVDSDWIQRRQTELELSADSNSPYSPYISAYGRARLEDYVRHQGLLPDGRVVARLPAFLADKDELAELGVLSDTFIHEYSHESSGDNLIVILPLGWTMRPADTPTEDGYPIDPLHNERWAGVYDETATRRVTVFYNHKPFPYADGFRSYTRVEEAKPAH